MYRSHIDTLEKDNAEVDIDLNLALSRDNASKDRSNALTLRKFVADCHTLKEQIEQESQIIATLNEKVWSELAFLIFKNNGFVKKWSSFLIWAVHFDSKNSRFYYHEVAPYVASEYDYIT